MMSEIKTITAEQLQAKVEAEEVLNIIDVREDFEVANGMIPNAIHIPMNTIPEQLSVFDQKQSYYIVCAGGVRSENVCHYLVENGINAINMVGGMHSWNGEVK